MLEVSQFHPNKQHIILIYQNILLFDKFPRNDNAYFVAYLYEMYGWNLAWQALLWHHSGCYQGLRLWNNQVTCRHGTMAIRTHVNYDSFGRISSLYIDSIWLFEIDFVLSRYNENWSFDFSHCGNANDPGISSKPSPSPRAVSRFPGRRRGHSDLNPDIKSYIPSLIRQVPLPLILSPSYL